MSKNQRIYEVLYIVRPDISEGDVAKLIERFKTVVTDHSGVVESASIWERRKLAYEIMGHKEGVYILMKFSGEPQLPAELNRLMRISDDVLRQMITTVEEPKVKPEAATPA